MMTDASTKSSSSPPTHEHVLIELVSANLELNQEKNLRTWNTFCIVRDVPPTRPTLTLASSSSSQAQEQSEYPILHKTKIIPQSNSPVWTIHHDSLYLLDLFPTKTKTTTKNINNNNNKTDNVEEQGSILFQLYHSSSTIKNHLLIGYVEIKKETLLKGTGQRKEYALRKPLSPSASRKGGERGSGVTKSILKNKNKTYSGQSNTKKSSSFVTSTTIPTDDNDSVHNISQKISLLLNNNNRDKKDIYDTLALRFRIAKQHEIKFMKQHTDTTLNKIPKWDKEEQILSNTELFLLPNIHNSETMHLRPTTFSPLLNNSIPENCAEIKVDKSGLSKSTISRGLPCDFSFRSDQPSRVPVGRSMIQTQLQRLTKRRQKKGEHLSSKTIRVKPYPDKDNLDVTTWLTKEQINDIALLPSTKWIVNAGCDTETSDEFENNKLTNLRGGQSQKQQVDKEEGKKKKDKNEDEEDHLGTVYLEILKCDNLPNMDLGIAGDITDAFVAIVFEDNLVRTDVIDDELSPRWLPWTQRAFSFPINRPGSLLFIGVFDKDKYGDHDYIGRIVVNMSNFLDNTVYLLQYTLHSDANKNDDRGVITIRLRKEFNHKTKKEMLKRSFQAPKKILLNVPSLKSFHLVKYLCRGQVDMDKSSIGSVKFYQNELYTHFDNCLFLADDILRILLWRGRKKVKIPLPKCLLEKRVIDNNDDNPSTEYSNGITVSLWFPIRSVLLFQAVITAIENPRLIPGLWFCGLGFTLSSFMFGKCRHPSPWDRCKNLDQIVDDIFVGNKGDDISIDPHVGIDLEEAHVKLYKARVERVKKLFKAVKGFLKKSRTDFSKIDKYAHLTATEEQKSMKDRFNLAENLLQTPIYYIHLLLQSICQVFRMVRNVFTWDSSYYSFMIMTTCFGIGLFLLLFPYGWFLLWSCRICAWICLGPW